MPVALLPQNNIQEKSYFLYFFQLYAIIYCVQDKIILLSLEICSFTKQITREKCYMAAMTYYACSTAMVMAI